MTPEKSRGERTLRQSKSALLEAAEAAVADRKGKPDRLSTGPVPQASRLRPLLVGLLIAGAALLIWRPTWLAGPSLPPETPAVVTASATMALARAISHIKAFNAANGRLPSRLSDAGIQDAAIEYRPLPNGEFTVSRQGGQSMVTLRSTDSLEARVVEAIRILQRRS